MEEKSENIKNFISDSYDSKKLCFPKFQSYRWKNDPIFIKLNEKDVPESIKLKFDNLGKQSFLKYSKSQK